MELIRPWAPLHVAERIVLRPNYTVRLCRIRQAYDRPTTWIFSCKSNLQLAYDCRVGSKSCRRPVASLLYATKSYRVNRPLLIAEISWRDLKNLILDCLVTKIISLHIYRTFLSSYDINTEKQTLAEQHSHFWKNSFPQHTISWHHGFQLFQPTLVLRC